MDNKSAIEATLKFFTDNVKAFGCEEPREYATDGFVTTISYQNEAGDVRNGRIHVGKVVIGSTKRYINIELNKERTVSATATSCRIRKLIPNKGDVKFDKKFKERLEEVMEFIEGTYKRGIEQAERNNAINNFKTNMKESLAKIGVNITFGSASERLNETSTEIEVRDRTAKFTALTDDVELLRKLREVCENHTRSN